MATKLETVKFGDGKELVVETDEFDVVGLQVVGLGAVGEIDFASALEHIKGVAGKLLDALQTIAVPPDDCEVSFGIKLSASAGVILAKAGSEANFGVKMNWSRKK